MVPSSINALVLVFIIDSRIGPETEKYQIQNVFPGK